jgi:hypothetical protein
VSVVDDSFSKDVLANENQPEDRYEKSNLLIKSLGVGLFPYYHGEYCDEHVSVELKLQFVGKINKFLIFTITLHSSKDNKE